VAEAFAPAASWTRRYLPAGIVPEIGVAAVKDPAADAYCTDHPETSTSAVLLLNNSIKSFL
jgi:hypothetical protein